jgi:hypothetical protein
VRAQTVTGYTALLDVIRARRAELGVSFEVLDLTAGLTPGHSQKIIGETPVKNFGRVSLECILGALGLVLVVRPDPVGLARVQGRLAGRLLSHPVRRKDRPAAASVAAGESNVVPAI